MLCRRQFGSCTQQVGDLTPTNAVELTGNGETRETDVKSLLPQSHALTPISTRSLQNIFHRSIEHVLFVQIPQKTRYWPAKMVANPVTGKSNEERFISSSDLICCLSPLSQPQHLQLHIWRLFGNLRQYLETIWTLYKDNKEREGVENFCHTICLPLGRKNSQYFCKNNSDTIREKAQKISGRNLF